MRRSTLSIVGVDHRYDKTVTIDLQNQEGSPLFLRFRTWIDGLLGSHVKGIEAVPRLLESKDVNRVTSMNTFVVVPLITDAFQYNLVCFPGGTMLKSDDLKASFKFVAELGKLANLNIVCEGGDGDSLIFVNIY